MANNVMNMDGSFKPFRAWCQHVLPLVYDDSLSYMELLNKVIVYINSFGEYLEEYTVINKIVYEGIWDITKNYKINSVVSDHNYGYLSLKAVPAGVPITATEYWLKIADFAGELIDLGERVLTLEGKMDTAEDDIDTLQVDIIAAQGDITSIAGRVSTAESNITSLSNQVTNLYNRAKDYWKHSTVLFIGDSYGAGWNNDEGTVPSWEDAIISALQIPTYYKYNEGGAGFGTGTGHWYGHLLENFILEHSDIAGTITDIIIAGGYNDYNQSNDYDTDNSLYGMKWCETYINEHFVNATVYCGMIARTPLFTNISNYSNINRTITKYKNGSLLNGWYYINHSEIMVHEYADLSSDGKHLLSTGYAKLGRKMSESLINGDFYHNFQPEIAMTLETTGDNTGLDVSGSLNPTISTLITENSVSVKMQNELFIQLNSQPLTSHTGYKLCRYSGNATCRNQISLLFRYFININISITATDNTTFETTGRLVFSEDGFIWFYYNGVVQNGTNWRTYTTKQIVIYPFEANIPIQMC